jgi:VanZ family protein
MKRLIIFLLKPISFIPALIMMYIIFSFSAQDGTASSNLSYKVSYKVIAIADQKLDLNLTDKQITSCIRKINYYVRKTAHVTEYFILAVSIALPLYVYGLRGILLTLVAGIICVGFAFSDEFHQFYIQGRSSSTRDVFIDSCGSILGIISVRMFCYIIRKSVFEPLSGH